jgi:predicted CopG family antitoxin
MSTTKTIRIKKETYENLSEEGTFRDSFDTIIQKLLEKGNAKEEATTAN